MTKPLYVSLAGIADIGVMAYIVWKREGCLDKVRHVGWRTEPICAIEPLAERLGCIAHDSDHVSEVELRLSAPAGVPPDWLMLVLSSVWRAQWRT